MSCFPHLRQNKDLVLIIFSNNFSFLNATNNIFQSTALVVVVINLKLICEISYNILVEMSIKI